MLKLSRPSIPESAIASVADVLRSGNLVHGAECNAFEAELADYLSCDDVVLVSSGTAALHLSLLALGIGDGHAVIVPDFSFAATANSVEMAGATVKLVDVDPETYVLSTEHLEETIADWSAPETLKAIIPVHEFGCPANISEIARLASTVDAYVIEDAACALGATLGDRKTGGLADAGCFSFHPRKTLTTGEGGAIAVNDPDLAHRLRLLRSHGMDRSEGGVVFREPGLNYRMTDFQAAIGRAQLPDMDDRIDRRRRLAATYRELLSSLESDGNLSLPRPVPGHSWQTFMVVLNERFDRDEISRRLREAGVESGMGAQSMSSLGIYRDYVQTSPLSNGHRLYRQGLALPMDEGLIRDDIVKVVAALQDALAAKA